MTTYMIFLREETYDADALTRYVEKSLPTFQQSVGTALAFNGDHRVLEGEPLEGIVILSFPSRDDALAWYDSPAYQEAAAMRKPAARMSVMMVEGLAPVDPGEAAHAA
jgi:uncharacterized protein (DUF1330 family)